jgi:hypothetical protein
MKKIGTVDRVPGGYGVRVLKNPVPYRTPVHPLIRTRTVLVPYTRNTFQLLRVENAIIAAGIKHLVLHHTAHMGWLVWCRVLHASKQDDRE